MALWPPTQLLRTRPLLPNTPMIGLGLVAIISFHAFLNYFPEQTDVLTHFITHAPRQQTRFLLVMGC
jgi:hypothetical protein